nr:TIGR03943 family protein [Micromonospora coxensis]
MNRRAQAVIMLLFGGTIVKVSLTGVYLRYVKEGLRPFLVVAGLILVAAAVMTLWHEWRKPSASKQHDHGHDDGHGHAHEPWVGWLMMLPALALLLMAPPALGSYAAGQAGTISASEISDAPPLPPGDVVPLSLLEYASRSLYDGGKSLAGRKVRLVGFITPGADGKPMLARIIMSCCAADGRPIKVGLAGDVPSAAPDTWVEVVGRYTATTSKDPVNDADIPYLEVASWTQTATPEKPYQ